MDNWISLRCWGSASFMKNTTRSLSHLGTRVGIASWNTHLKLNLCWFGMKIHNHTICLPIDRRDENVRRWKPLLLEWDVTSTQTTSGHNLNRRNAGLTIQATPMNSESSLMSCLSRLSWMIWFNSDEMSDALWRTNPVSADLNFICRSSLVLKFTCLLFKCSSMFSRYKEKRFSDNFNRSVQKYLWSTKIP